MSSCRVKIEELITGLESQTFCIPHHPLIHELVINPKCGICTICSNPTPLEKSKYCKRCALTLFRCRECGWGLEETIDNLITELISLKLKLLDDKKVELCQELILKLKCGEVHPNRKAVLRECLIRNLNLL